MPTTIEGTLSAAGLRFAIVASRFNGLIVEPLVAGALDAIVRSGGSADDVTIVRCPGAWELPQVVRRVLDRGGIDALVAVGAVIRGSTPHFDYVAGEAARGIAGALDAIVRSGGSADDVTIVRCPGAWELPQVVRRVVARGGFDAVIALGAVIRGSTPHFDYVAGEAAKGIAQTAMTSDIAVSFGVLTTDTIEQALERAGTKAGNKGFDAAMAAIELANLYRALAGGGRKKGK